VINEWTETICSVLKIKEPVVVVKNRKKNAIPDEILGQNNLFDKTIVIYAYFNLTYTSYLITLAHELRHQFQDEFCLGISEIDAVDFSIDFYHKYKKPLFPPKNNLLKYKLKYYSRFFLP
jgi:hypothetical protein